MIIYKITNLINGKIYIGQDSNNNPNYYGSGVLINKAIKKYGIENFKKDVIEYCNSIDELNEAEIRNIKEYKSRVEFGNYNLTDGGDGLKNASKQTRKLMSDRMLGCIPWNKDKKGIYSENTLIKMSDAKRNKSSWNKGIKTGPHSKKSNIKRSETMMGKNKNKKRSEKFRNECRERALKQWEIRRAKLG